jgi:putative sterol carrier protein
MTTYQYCTPEWLEESAKAYRSNPEAQQNLKKLTADMAYRVKADPAFGIDRDILFCAYFDEGKLNKLELISEETAKAEAEYIMVATPTTWKKVLKKERKFLTDFLLGNIKLEKGSKVGVLGVAPHANNIVASLTPFELVFGNDLSGDEREQYRTNMEAFRKELGV